MANFEGLKIKPLTWIDQSGDNDGWQIKWRGNTGYGTCYIAKAVRDGDMILCNGGYFRTIEEAKAAAQADYEKRVCFCFEDEYHIERESKSHKATMIIRPEVAGDQEYWRIRGAISQSFLSAEVSLIPSATVDAVKIARDFGAEELRATTDFIRGAAYASESIALAIEDAIRESGLILTHSHGADPEVEIKRLRTVLEQIANDTGERDGHLLTASDHIFELQELATEALESTPTSNVSEGSINE